MINFKKLQETLKLALEEEIFDGHIDKEELSSEIFNLLNQIAEEDKDGLIIHSEDFKTFVEQLQTETPEDEENETLTKLIDEIGPNNYEMLLNDELNYIIIHVEDDAEMNDIKQDPDQIEDDMLECLNEIAMERYLCVDPNPDDEINNAVLTLCQTDGTSIDAFAFHLDYDSIKGDKDQYIRSLAKDCFQDPITDDIRVQWY